MFAIHKLETKFFVLCDNVFILMCICRILIKGYLLTYLQMRPRTPAATDSIVLLPPHCARPICISL